MDMVGLRYIEAGKLKTCDMICFEDWRNDLQVLEVKKENNKVITTVKGFEKDSFVKELSEDEIIVICR